MDYRWRQCREELPNPGDTVLRLTRTNKGIAYGIFESQLCFMEAGNLSWGGSLEPIKPDDWWCPCPPVPTDITKESVR